MQNTYKAYIFDFDYALVDSSPGIITCFRHVLTLHNHHNITDHDIRRTIGHTLEHSFTILTGITNPQTLATYKQQYTTHADTCMTKLTQFFPETVNVLQQLHNRGTLLGIVSTKYRYRIQEMLRTNNQPHLADFIIGGEDVTHPKPNPEGLLLAKNTHNATHNKYYTWATASPTHKQHTKQTCPLQPCYTA